VQDSYHTRGFPSVARLRSVPPAACSGPAR